MILELEKIKEEYYSKNWNDRDDALRKIFRYSDHSNEIVAGAIFDFLSSVSYETRGGMPGEIASIIESLIISFFPSSSNSEDKEEMIENGTECIHVGYVMIYDAFIHLNDFDIALNGLLILKYIYSRAKYLNLPVLSKAVLDTYENLESILERPERTDLGNAKEFLSIFRTDLETSGLVLPSLPDHLYNLAFK